MEILLWSDGLTEYSGIGPAHPVEERKRGRKSERKSGRRWRGEEEGGQDVRVGEEKKKKTCEQRRCTVAGSKSRSGSASDAGLTRPLQVALVTQTVRQSTRNQHTLTAAS